MNCPPTQAELVTCKPHTRALDQAGELRTALQEVLERHIQNRSGRRISAGLGIKDHRLKLVTVPLLAQVQLDVRRIGRLVALLVTTELCRASVVCRDDLTRELLLEPELAVLRGSVNHIVIDRSDGSIELVGLGTLLVVANHGQIDGVLERASLVVEYI